MVATVNASTSAGVVITPDNSGVLAFQSSSATALTIDASQNATFVGTATATKLIPTGTSVTGNGLYLPAANSLGLSTNGTEAMRIDSSGNMLVGTTSATFTYTGSSTATAKQVISTSGYDCLNLISTAANPGIDFSQPNSASTIYRYANITGVMTTTTAGSESGALTFATGNAGANSTERGRFTNDGSFLVATTANIGANARIYAVGSGKGIAVGTGPGSNTFRHLYMNTSDTSLYFFNDANYASLNGAGAWTNASDARLKKNIVNIKYGLADVLKAQPRSYQMNDVAGDFVGFVAQELKEVIPEVVSGDPEKQLGVDYGSLVAVAFKAIQELKAINDTQAETINALTARIVALENR